MVNPYAQQRQQRPFSIGQNQLVKSKTSGGSNVSLGQSQALKSLEKFERKSFNKNGNSDDSDTEDESSDSILKRTKKTANKFLKKTTPKQVSQKQKSKSITKSSGDDSGTESDEEDDDISIEFSQNIASRKSDGASSSSRKNQNKVKFGPKKGKKSPTSNKKQQDMKSDDDIIDDDHSIARNLIIDIHELDVESVENSTEIDEKPSKPSKTTNQTDRNKLLSVSKSDEKDASKYSQSDSDDSYSRPNLILDIEELDDLLPVKQKQEHNNERRKIQSPVDRPLKSALVKPGDSHKRSSRRRTPVHMGSRSHSIVSTIDSENNSIVTEIVDDEEIEKSEDSVASEVKTFNEQSSHRMVSFSKTAKTNTSYYQEDFDTESDVSRIQSYKSKSKHHKTSTSVRVDNFFGERKSTETQVDELDLMKHSDLVKNLSLYSPHAYGLGTRVHLKDLNSLIQFDTVSNSFNDLIKMNLVFMKNFLSTQRQIYETELSKIKPK